MLPAAAAAPGPALSTSASGVAAAAAGAAETAASIGATAPRKAERQGQSGGQPLKNKQLTITQRTAEVFRMIPPSVRIGVKQIVLHTTVPTSSPLTERTHKTPSEPITQQQQQRQQQHKDATVSLALLDFAVLVSRERRKLRADLSLSGVRLVLPQPHQLVTAGRTGRVSLSVSARYGHTDPLIVALRTTFGVDQPVIVLDEAVTSTLAALLDSLSLQAATSTTPRADNSDTTAIGAATAADASALAATTTQQQHHRVAP